MRLALAILVFWLGMACVYIAFHGLTGEPSDFAGAVEQIPDSIRSVLAGQGPSDLSGSWTAPHAAGDVGSIIAKGAQAVAPSSTPNRTTGTVLNA